MKIRSHHILWILVIMFFAGFSYLFYEIFLDGVVNPVLEYRTDPMALNTDKPAYHPGDTIKVELNVCKKRNVAAEVHWSLVDSILVDFPSYDSAVSPSCIDSWTTIGTVPKGSVIGAEDLVHVEGWVTYRFNDFNTRVYRLRSKPFKVI